MSAERYELNKQLAQMLKGGVIMDVTTPEQARIAEEAGACAAVSYTHLDVYKRQMMICQNMRLPIVHCLCCSVVHRDVRHIREMYSICIPDCWSVPAV